MTPQVVVARTRTIEDEHRTFSVARVDLKHQYGIGDGLLEELLDCGLPHSGTGDQLLFDPLDVANVASDLDLECPERVLLRRWSRSLGADLQQQRGSYELRLDLRCPAPGHEGPCRFTVRPLTAAMLPDGVPELLTGDSVAGRAEPLHDPYDFGAGFAEVTAAAQRLVFHRIPEAYVDDLGYLAETGLADCQLANTHLRNLAEKAGFVVRPAAGLFVGVPFPARHVWFEVSVGDRWVAADPFFLSTLTSWGLIDPTVWPLDRSPCNVLIRLATLPTVGGPLALHDGVPAPERILARWVPAVSGQPL